MIVSLKAAIYALVLGVILVPCPVAICHASNRCIQENVNPGVHYTCSLISDHGAGRRGGCGEIVRFLCAASRGLCATHCGDLTGILRGGGSTLLLQAMICQLLFQELTER